MNSYHRGETNRFLYFVQLQFKLFDNFGLRNQLALPDQIHESMFSQTILQFMKMAYQHYLLEIAETTQCKLVAERAVPMLKMWESEGWFSDQLNELVKLESTESWLSKLLSVIDEAQSLNPASDNSLSNDVIATTTESIDPIQSLRRGYKELEELIRRQRDLSQNY